MATGTLRTPQRTVASLVIALLGGLLLLTPASVFAQVLMPQNPPSAPGGFGSSALPTPSPAPSVRPIEPPVYVFPYPVWMVVVAVFVVLALLGFGIWAYLRHLKNRPVPPPPTPREVALAALEGLRERVATIDPYPFSIEVSDVLRTYVGAEYGVHARQQTAPEFLAAVAGSLRISEADRTLLAAFLELSDLIKFARMNARRESSEQLLEQALRFVQKGENAA